MKRIEKYTFGVGDRFAHQAQAQLRAFQHLESHGIEVIPIWNKSNREHNFVGSEPQSVIEAARRAVVELDWKKAWHVDADHIGLQTVDRFIPHCDFFTIDVADFIGKPAPTDLTSAFLASHRRLIGVHNFAGLDAPIRIEAADLSRVSNKYLFAAHMAGEVYRHIEKAKAADQIIAEVSMDETDDPQTPSELLIILAALAYEKIPIQTIAPKFTGRFNKGVDYVGDLRKFEAEFFNDIAVIGYAIEQFGLPETLKLSVHSGSDKFSLYPIIQRALRDTGAGIHIKTAGTTWLEELIGLAEAGGDGLRLAKEIYEYAKQHIDEFCAPYASVIAIDRSQLPDPKIVEGWSGSQLAEAIRHVPSNPHFNQHVRQLLHVSFKVAAQQGARYTDLLRANRDIVEQQVTTNLFERHLKPIFLG